MRTLHVRMPVICSNAATVAARLEQHPAIERVYHTSLESHPDHEVAQRVLPKDQAWSPSWSREAMLSLAFHAAEHHPPPASAALNRSSSAPSTRATARCQKRSHGSRDCLRLAHVSARRRGGLVEDIAKLDADRRVMHGTELLIAALASS